MAEVGGFSAGKIVGEIIHLAFISKTMLDLAERSREHYVFILQKDHNTPVSLSKGSSYHERTVTPESRS